MLVDLNGKVISTKKRLSKGMIVLLWITFLGFGMFLTIIGFLTAPGGGHLFLTGVILLIFGYSENSKYCAKYEFCKDGIWAKYPFESEKLVYWEEFQQVCICYGEYTNWGYAFVIMAFVKNGEELNVQGRWKTVNTFKHRSVITMDYTDELYEEVKKYCPYEIVDLRNTDSYKKP